jgi:GNAT superfamily N-acetyltransferase
LIDTDELEVLDAEVAVTDAEVEFTELTSEHAAALTRCLYRCYGWSYPSPSMYYPDRIAAALEAGTRIGEVAVDANGEVAAHWGAVFLTDGVVETGGTVTDPRFRRRGLANVLGDRLLERLVSMGVHGRLREPVMTHSATQAIALREGAVLMGINLQTALPLQQVGITDGVLDERLSISVFYGPLVPLHGATLHAPAIYTPILNEVLSKSEWGYRVADVRPASDIAAHSTVASSYDSVNRVGSIEVTEVGTDLVDVIDEVLNQLRRGGAEVVRAMLPLDQPATASIGAGLGSLGFAYAFLAPRYGRFGNVLFVQWLRNPEIDMSSWVFADPHVERVAGMIVAQVAELNRSAVALRRREARRQQLFAALPAAD